MQRPRKITLGEMRSRAALPGAGADETAFLGRRSHPETNQCSHRPRSNNGVRSCIGRKPEASHEASNSVRNRSRYPSRCRNHHAVVAVTFDRASCRGYSHRSVQEFSQLDRSQSFRTIALLTWGVRFTEARMKRLADSHFVGRQLSFRHA